MKDTIINQAHIEKSFSYTEYKELINSLLKEGKTTGPVQSEQLVEYTTLNFQRMKKWDKIITIDNTAVQKLHEIKFKIYWVVISEGWCGDAAQNIPVIAKMATINANIQLRIILRDENLDVMDSYLTNGGRSIPKLICLNADTLQELGTWGPRPEPVQELFISAKNTGIEKTEIIEKIHAWYAKDKGETIQKEFRNKVGIWISRNN